MKLTFGRAMLAYLAGWLILTWLMTTLEPAAQFGPWFWADTAYSIIFGILIISWQVRKRTRP